MNEGMNKVMKTWKREDVVSAIDSQRFGVTIAKVDHFSEDIPADVHALRDLGVQLVISRVSSSNVELINALEDEGFRLKDTQLTFEYSLHKQGNEAEGGADRVSGPSDSEITIEQAVEEDTVRVGELAHDAFKGYGHYACNSRLDSKQANEIYRDWATRSCLDKRVADHLFVAKVNATIAGFLSLKIVEENSTKLGIQHLGAVDPAFRSHGIFRLLILRCLALGHREGHPLQRTFLQSINVPVIRSYQKLGFKTAGSNHTMHAWL